MRHDLPSLAARRTRHLPVDHRHFGARPRATAMSKPYFRRGTPFWDRCEQMPSGCWEWRGPILRAGYGSAWDSTRGTMGFAHRVAWRLANGRLIPPGLEIAHHCDNPPCVRPEHLFLATHAENVRDSASKGRHNGGGYRWMTHCRRGHPFDEANTYRWHRQRVCRACRRIKERRYHDKKKAAAA